MKDFRDDIARCIEDLPDDDALIDDLIGLVDEALICGGDYDPFDDLFLGQNDPQTALEKPAKTSRTLSFVTNIVYYTLIAVALFIAFAYTSDGQPRVFFGYSGFTVLTRSMQSELPQGSFIFTKKLQPSAYNVGDDITFFQADGKVVTHRIITIYENYDNSGQRGFETKGLMNAKADKEIIVPGNVLGKVIHHNLMIGKGVAYVKANFLVITILLAMIIAFAVVFKIYLRNKEPKRPRKTRYPKMAPIPSV